MNLIDAQHGVDYMIKQIKTEDAEMDRFLFSLGCYPGEIVTLIKRVKSGCVVSMKDGRYTMDHLLAQAIEIQDVMGLV